MKKPRLIRVLLMSALFWLANNAYTDDRVEAAVEYRQGVMNIVGWNFKHMGAMLKGKSAFDQAAFSAYANELQVVTRFNLLSGFPEDSDESDETAAKAEIWMDWEDFQQKLKDLQQQTAELASIAGQRDQAAIKQQFDKTAKACKACHKAYKE